MLSREENELLTRTGPGTPMGALLRQYWIPVVLSNEVAPGGRVKRVKLLGERLIAFRAKNGRPGLVGEFCPHRLASLYFGRVEEAGMRCVYHGWKFGMDGRCLEMPNEPAESGFATKIRHVGYPCEERGGMIWAYMGPESPPPPLPHLEWTVLPDSHSFASKRVQECNWFQAMEGGIDSSHISFLHAPINADDAEVNRELDRASFGIGVAVQTTDRAPRFEVVDTDYGVLIGARRTQPALWSPRSCQRSAHPPSLPRRSEGPETRNVRRRRWTNEQDARRIVDVPKAYKLPHTLRTRGGNGT